MTRRPARLAACVVLVALFALPGATLGADPAAGAPPATVVEWQEHLDPMRAMGPNLGAHITDCIEMHGSMAGLLGPNGMMVQGMAGMMGREGQP